ncbi:MAG: AAA family ATPase [Methylocystis sp.]|uniref:AAA family ATPase n=1 Tax=Methylocystis sp. TaxID=1911079 RepID=UPI003DA4C2D1
MTDWAPLDDNPPQSKSRPASDRRFRIEQWSEIAFDGREEWAIKRVLPRVGLAAIFGKPGSFKSFIVSHIGLSIALGWDWAGRRVHQAPVVIIAAEAAAGLRKRKAGFQIAHPNLPDDVPFMMIPTAPNLGAEKGDLAALVSAIDAARVAPGLLVLDTLAATLGGNDENGAGMTAFVANAGALAERFNCLVLVVHHTGLGDDRRMRGHSSLLGALDAAILCERVEGDIAATLTLAKLKDDTSDVKLIARLDRIVIGHDEDGDEISTLVVDSVEDATDAAPKARAPVVPPSQRLFMEVTSQAIDELGETFRPFPTGPLVRAVSDEIVRERYYTRIAEKPKEGDTAKKLADRQRQAFNSAIKKNLDAKRLVAGERNGGRVLWLP